VQLVALLTDHDSVEDWPEEIDAGLVEIVTLGSAAVTVIDVDFCTVPPVPVQASA
jgi:hypothetical protein